MNNVAQHAHEVEWSEQLQRNLEAVEILDHCVRDHVRKTSCGHEVPVYVEIHVELKLGVELTQSFELDTLEQGREVQKHIEASPEEEKANQGLEKVQDTGLDVRSENLAVVCQLEFLFDGGIAAGLRLRFEFMPCEFHAEESELVVQLHVEADYLAGSQLLTHRDVAHRKGHGFCVVAGDVAFEGGGLGEVEGQRVEVLDVVLVVGSARLSARQTFCLT